MNELDDFHNRIGQLLIDAGPSDAHKIIARAKLPLDGESCEYEYDYVDQEGKDDWFVPDKLASHDLRLLLVKMRDFYIQNNMTNGRPAWTACEIIIDIPAEKINISFQYDD
ncbi:MULTISPECIES: antitoxin YezG family protein [Tenebrionibacter/Tenebrionicola group]|jgi:hypothetical protein|uniref:Uncharacterized protein n=2 Tax=Tenebrionibacter/Tenebrionicola group TaxID=2969848 RepID=A0A8K0VA53_9ENTR|nr:MULTISPECIES: antitoxin YezG family protein [Tenebrionibacter/Tenebrionicola group]MBK4717132.1 hypothetical protein [Tenebrionibacter intestinalis]MBV5097666.1 hypothetical protein [Tenebrionicola larvae]